jgi:tRNA threonylcarbamoyladenosine biosynthesis protein TsaB
MTYDLVIDSAADDTVVALARGGVIERMLRWDARQSQSVTLLPNIERLLRDEGAGKGAIAAVLLDLGPGGYASLRVGVSVAKALAHALGVPIAGVGRLELDAWLVREAAGGARIVAVHRAGRGDLAWAAYHADGAGVRQESAARLDPIADVVQALSAADVLTGEVDEELAAQAVAVGALVVAPEEHRAIALAVLGRARIDAGRSDDATTLVPVYLRLPAIGPQPAR